jgi:hypothetical protein
MVYGAGAGAGAAGEAAAGGGTRDCSSPLPSLTVGDRQITWNGSVDDGCGDGGYGDEPCACGPCKQLEKQAAAAHGGEGTGCSRSSLRARFVMMC